MSRKKRYPVLRRYNSFQRSTSRFFRRHGIDKPGRDLYFKAVRQLWEEYQTFSTKEATKNVNVDEALKDIVKPGGIGLKKVFPEPVPYWQLDNRILNTKHSQRIKIDVSIYPELEGYKGTAKDFLDQNKASKTVNDLNAIARPLKGEDKYHIFRVTLKNGVLVFKLVHLSQMKDDERELFEKPQEEPIPEEPEEIVEEAPEPKELEKKELEKKAAEIDKRLKELEVKERKLAQREKRLKMKAKADKQKITALEKKTKLLEKQVKLLEKQVKLMERMSKAGKKKAKKKN